MDWMRPAPSTILEFPDFNRATFWLGENPLGNVMPAYTIDFPLAALALKLEMTVCDCLIRGEGYVAKWILDRSIVLR